MTSSAIFLNDNPHFFLLFLMDLPTTFFFLKKGDTITEAYYASLLTKLRENIKLKRRGMLSNGVLLQHDNASPHTCVAATSKAAELGFQILPYPPYSLDLAPLPLI
jgi:histone-lysine N-methyltransferase SETMAR